ncbi:MAG: glycosyltransferase family 4 protein [Nanoarchaeota archaeon]|nr:glycosyltransferase family 4 protein [Nanoarchaeota archaeon]
MKIAILGENIVPPWTEGYKNLSWELAKALSENKDFEIYLWKDPKNDFSPKRKNIHFIPIFPKKRNLFGKIKLIVKTIKFLHKEKIGFAHFIYYPNKNNCLAFKLIERFSRVVCLQTVTLPPNKEEEIVSKNIMTMTKTTHNKLKKKLNNYFAYPLISKEKFKKTKSKALLKKLNIPSKYKVALYNAGPRPWYGFGDLMKSIPLVLKKNKKIIFVIANRDLDMPNFKKNHEFFKKWAIDKGLEKNVRFMGEWKDADELMNIADLLVIPLRRPKMDFPMSILEAFAKKIVVVGTKVGALPEILDGRGVLCEKENPENLAGGILRAIKIDKKDKRIKEASKFAINCLPENNIKNYERAYSSLK